MKKEDISQEIIEFEKALKNLKDGINKIEVAYNQLISAHCERINCLHEEFEKMANAEKTFHLNHPFGYKG